MYPLQASRSVEVQFHACHLENRNPCCHFQWARVSQPLSGFDQLTAIFLLEDLVFRDFYPRRLV